MYLPHTLAAALIAFLSPPATATNAWISPKSNDILTVGTASVLRWDPALISPGRPQQITLHSQNWHQGILAVYPGSNNYGRYLWIPDTGLEEGGDYFLVALDINESSNMTCEGDCTSGWFRIVGATASATNNSTMAATDTDVATSQSSAPTATTSLRPDPIQPSRSISSAAIIGGLLGALAVAVGAVVAYQYSWGAKKKEGEGDPVVAAPAN